MQAITTFLLTLCRRWIGLTSGEGLDEQA